MRLEARGLGFGYPGKPVGRGVDLAVGAGEMVCLLGPNGSGKTTLFKTLLGLLPAQGGEVRIDGRPLVDMARAEVARRVAYVPQAHAAHFPYRARHGDHGQDRAPRPVRPPRRARSRRRSGSARDARHRRSGRGRLHQDQRRPASARAVARALARRRR